MRTEKAFAQFFSAQAAEAPHPRILLKQLKENRKDKGVSLLAFRFSFIASFVYS